VKASILKIGLLGAVLAAGTIALAPDAMAWHNHERMYRVTITNAMLGQPLSPSVIATHTGAFRLFELGPAPVFGDDDYDVYFGLATIAETGNPNRLRDAVAAADGVYEAVALGTAGSPPILLPGESNSTVISASGRARYLSAAAMLGKTNDAAYALLGVELPKFKHDKVCVWAPAYDVGSEENTEIDTMTMGTPAVGGNDGDDPVSGMGINDGSGEGHIFVHAGIHGVGGMDGLDPAVYDWRNPVAKITIERIQ
jgi:hypothetical protein